jgi:hypothetical protein
MGYFLTSQPENAVPGKSRAMPKTHTPGSRLEKRGHRFYNPGLGRWASRDPVAELAANTVNAFVYRVANQEGIPLSTSNDRLYELMSKLSEGDDRSVNLNLYLYCFNNAVVFSDFIGLAVVGTIECKGGKFVSKLMLPPGVPAGVSKCSKKHEESHASDWEKAYPGWCKDKPDGTPPPTGGIGYNRLLVQSECAAYSTGSRCLRDEDDCKLSPAEKENTKRNRELWAKLAGCYCNEANKLFPNPHACDYLKP